MRLMVTGGAGFIGSAFVRAAIARGDTVVTVDRLSHGGDVAKLEAALDHPAHTFLHADVADQPTLEAALDRHRPDAVIHFAAESHVDRSIAGPLGFVHDNVVGTARLLEAFRAHRDRLPTEAAQALRFHQVSTDEVYGALGPDGLFDEDSPYAPRSPYAATKAAADHLVRAWANTYGLNVVLSTCSNNYGPWQDEEKLIPTVIARALAARPIPVYGRGENVRDWLYVEDHVDALFRVVKDGQAGRTYAIGAGQERANIDLVHTLCALLDDAHPEGAPHGRLIQFVDDRPGHDFRYGVDTGRISAELGWQATTSLEVGLERTVQWYLDHFGS